jgi:phosphoribosylcarboxyaminoimidazole (NCAIR) mutase
MYCTPAGTYRAPAGFDPRTSRGLSATHGTPGTRRHASGSAPAAWEIVLIVAVAVAIVLATLLAGGTTHRVAAVPTRTVSVGPADTLWSLAASNPVPGQTTVATVEEIRALNGLRTASLSQGATLRVPMAESPDRSYASR